MSTMQVVAWRKTHRFQSGRVDYTFTWQKEHADDWARLDKPLEPLVREADALAAIKALQDRIDTLDSSLECEKRMRKDAEENDQRYRRLKEWFASANFFPEEMDLDPGVALIFIAPLGLEVSADLDATIDKEMEKAR